MMRRILSLLLSVSIILQANIINVHAEENVRITTISKANGFENEKITYTSFNETGTKPRSNYVLIEPLKTGQTILGMGGAMTESAAYNISKMTPDKQKEVYEAYYGETGARYNLLRVSIGSADFSLSSYSYDDSNKADPNLTKFSIAKDYDYVIPALLRVKGIRPDVKVFSAPWAPPGWMKKSGKRTNGVSLGGIGLVNNAVNPKYYEAYANYFVKYVQSYKEAGIDIYSLSMQNESQNNPAWECATWTTKEAINFISNYLGPALERNNIDAKLVIWDWDKGNDTLHKDGFIKYNTQVLSNASARKYIDGVAFHWYAGDLWHEIAGKPMWSEDFYSLDEVKNKFPDIHLYATEACQEKGPWFNSYEPAYRYIHDVLNDFEHGTECFIDWNLVLDKNGGPTHDVENNCHAAIMLDEYNNPVYQPSYYVLKMISRTMKEGSLHINTESDNTQIDKTAVIDESGNVSVLLGNTSSKDISLTLVEDNKTLKVTLPAYSLTKVEYAEKSLNHTHSFGNYTAVDENKHQRVCVEDSYVEETDHNYDKGVNSIIPNCITEGKITYTCSDCGYIKEVSVNKDLNNHTGLTEVVDIKDPSCKEEGYTGSTICSDCKTLLSKGETVSKLQHEYNEGTVTVASTCINTGIKSYTCLKCGYVLNETIFKDKDNHINTEVKNYKEATVFNAGYTGDLYCKDCKTLLKQGEEITKLICTHSYDEGTVTKTATCVSKGEKTYICKICNDSKTEETDYDYTNHIGEYTVVGYKDADCKNTGYTGDKYCKSCTNLIESGTVIEINEDHDFGPGVVTVNATCTTTGVKVYTCRRCSETKDETILINLNNHSGKTEVINQKDPSCKEEGYTGDTICSSCKNVLIKGNSISKTDNHIYDKGTVTIKPTVEHKGELTYTCTICGNTYTEDIDKLIETEVYEELKGITNKEAYDLKDNLYIYNSDLNEYQKAEIKINEKTVHIYTGEDGNTYNLNDLSDKWISKKGITYKANSLFVTSSLKTYTRTHKSFLFINRYWYVNDADPKDITPYGSTAASARSNFTSAKEFGNTGAQNKNATSDDPYYVACTYIAVKDNKETVKEYSYYVNDVLVTNADGSNNVSPLTLYKRIK